MTSLMYAYTHIERTKSRSLAGLNLSRTWDTQARRNRTDGAWHMQWIRAAGFSPSCPGEQKREGGKSKKPIQQAMGWG